MTRKLVTSVVVLSALVVPAIAAGCSGSKDRLAFNDEKDAGGEGGPVFGGQPEVLIVEPSNAAVFIDTATTPATPGKLGYTVKVKSNGADQDLTADAKFTIEDPTLGSFAGATFTTAPSLPDGKLGMSTIVRVEAKSFKGAANLTVVALRNSGDNKDFYFFEPYQKSAAPDHDVLRFSTNIKQVDVAFVMDTTGSMSGSINNLKSALTTGGLLTQLQTAIPSVGVAIVDHRDYPVEPNGSPGDWPVNVRQTVTSDLTKINTALAPMAAGGGNDGPEAQIPAMQHVLTGEALTWPGGSLAAHTPAAGTFGGVDFRPGSIPVVVLMTDIDWHGEGHTPYTFPTPTMATLMGAFTSKNARFVSVTSGDESQANQLSDATSSNVPPSAFGTIPGCPSVQCCTGVNGVGRLNTTPTGNCRLNFLHSNGTGLSNSIVNAIRAIAAGSTFDVTARASNAPGNPNDFDATRFIKTLRAKDEGDEAAGCPAAPAIDTDGDGIKDTFTALKVGTPVCFEVIPNDNTFVPPELQAQFFNANIDVLGMPGEFQLDRRKVIFLVPPKDASSR
jgi:hypothetical protein